MSTAHAPAPIALFSSPRRAPGRNGTQTVDRALALLHQIAGDSGHGYRLRDLAARTQLDPATARRLLRALAQHGFVEQDERSRRYYLGLEFFSVAAAASNRLDLAASVRSSLERLYGATGVSAAFMLCSGPDVVCVDLVRPAAANDTGLIDMGSRCPIGAGAFGIAVLSALPDLEGEDIVIHNVRRISQTPEAEVRAIRQALLASRRAGYALAADMAQETAAIAVALRNRDGRPEGALGFDGLRLAGQPTSALAEMARLLAGEVRILQDALWRLPAARRAWPHTDAC